MREFLEDAGEHRDDGYGRAQAHAKRQLPKRFYKETAVKPVDGGFAVTLDGRAIKTPGGKPFIVPAATLATAVAEEWAAQGELIDRDAMPMLRLTTSAVERGEDAIQELRAEILKFAGNDLLLYRAEYPAALVAEQERVWDAVLVKLARHFDVSFRPTMGVIHQAQPAATLAILSEALNEEGLWVLVALETITSITGSALLALALHHKLIDVEAVWVAARLDEDFQISQWGEVSEHSVRREQRRREFDAAIKMLALVTLD